MSKDSVSNELKYLIFQSGHMRNTFKAYPEHLLLDSTYLLNNCRMPLLTIMAVDGNNESSIVALILLSAETIDILVEVLGQVKEDNPWEVLSFMVDKDMAEISALKSLWPNATVEICLFHVLKAMKLKVSSLVCSAEAKEQVRQVFQRLAYSETPQIYDERVADLQALNVPQLSEYFFRNWHNIKESWVMAWRGETVNLFDNTNNRLESYHQKLKAIVRLRSPLYVMFRDVLRYVSLRQADLASKEFNSLFKVTLNCPKELQNTYKVVRACCTAFATNFVINEISKSNATTVHGAVVKDGHRDYYATQEACSCSTASRMLLPCRHIFAVRASLGLPLFSIALVGTRWTLKYQQGDKALPGVLLMASKSVVEQPVLSKQQKYAKILSLLKDVADVASECGMEQFKLLEHKVKDFKDNLLRGIVPSNTPRPTSSTSLTFLHQPNATIVLDQETEAVDTTASALLFQENTEAVDTTASALLFQENTEAVDTTASALLDHPYCIRPQESTSSESEINSFRASVVAPKAVPRRGRPKGSDQTVIGTKRSRPTAKKTPANKRAKLVDSSNNTNS